MTPLITIWCNNRKQSLSWKFQYSILKNAETSHIPASISENPVPLCYQIKIYGMVYNGNYSKVWYKIWYQHKTDYMDRALWCIKTSVGVMRTCISVRKLKWYIFLVFAMYCQSRSTAVQWITKPPMLLAGWEGSLDTCSR